MSVKLCPMLHGHAKVREIIKVAVEIKKNRVIELIIERLSQ
jgi:hypothetical protein